ncbi:MAG: GGDEF domain-containing protein [Herbaspirillum sp.]
MKLPFTFISQASIARNWHLYLYRFGLPLLAAANVVQAIRASTRVEMADGALTALLASLLWTLTWWRGLRLRNLDIGVSVLLWISFANALLVVGLFGSSSSINILKVFLYWAPLIAFYWGLVYHDQHLFGLGQAATLYAGFVWIDPKVQILTGQSLFVQGATQAVLQGVLVVGFVAMFSIVSAQMIENEALFLGAEHRANHDELTGLLNRRTFTQHFPSIARRCDDQQLDMALMLIDLDHFKLVNDQYGHIAGDQVLVRVSALLEAGLRGDDLLYRWGGDEFSAIMRDTDVDTAAQIAERLRQKVEKADFGFDHPITISIGVANRRPGELYQDLFRRADEAMLCGKQDGHNQVGVAVLGAASTMVPEMTLDSAQTDSISI